MSFILSIFFDFFYVCVCGSRLDKGAIKKRRKSRTKGQMRAFRLAPAAAGATSNKMDGAGCFVPEDDIRIRFSLLFLSSRLLPTSDLPI
jgi:hypothetical protein